MNSLLDTPSIWFGQTTYQTRVTAQKFHNSRSDSWIVLKFLQEFAEDVFLGVDKISLCEADNV
jgi:hypothetical protein